MPSDKVYEYILFRGSDIRDRQVKSSLPVQSTQSMINDDPAIIHSHYPRPPSTSSTIPSAPTNSLLDFSIQNPPTLQGGPPLYPPGPNFASWAPIPPPPNPNSTGLPMPMYWPGFYGPPNGVPQLHQQLLRPPTMQYPVYNGSLPGGVPIMPTSNMPEYSAGPTVPTESGPTPSLVTPGQLQAAALSVPVTQNEVEAVQVAQKLSSESESSVPVPVSVPVTTETQPPILPLPPQARVALKTNGGHYQNRQTYNYRGRERSRGYGGSQSVVKFTEEFDFNTMNEKFNKDEIWGTLGKVNKSTSKENDASFDDDEYEDENENKNDADVHLPKAENVKGVYSKDDFFDTLSCNSQSNNNGRTRFSGQMKLDTETFGEYSRYRGGGRGGYRGRGGGGGGY